MWKKVLIGLAAVAGVAVVALVALVAFVDANRFKPEIERYVHDRTGRRLHFGGDLSLSVFPRIALALPRTTLSNRAGDRESASLAGARVSVALWPLLRGKIAVGTVRIDGLTAAVERRRDGSTSIDDLFQGEPATAGPDGGKPPEFEIGGIELTGADLTFNDLAQGRTIRLAKLNLRTGRLASAVRTPLQLDTAFSSSAPAAEGELRLAGTLDLDLAARRFGFSALEVRSKTSLDRQPVELVLLAGRVTLDADSGSFGAERVDVQASGRSGTVQVDDLRVLAPALAFDPAKNRVSIGGLEASARGAVGDDRFEAGLVAPKLDVTETTASGQRATLNARLDSQQAARWSGTVQLTLDGFSGSARQLDVERVALAADVRQGARRVAAAIAGPLGASLQARTLSLPRFAGEITLEDPALAGRSLKMPLSARLALDARAEKVDAGLSSRFDDTSAAAEFNVRGFAAPQVTFEVGADRLNVDRYFPPAPAAPGNDSADPKEDPKVDLSPIRALHLSGSVKVGQLQARGVKASQIDVQVRAANGKMDLAPVNAQLYGGALAGAARLAAEGNRIGVDASLADVSIGPLMRDLLERDLLEGRGNVKLDLDTGGATVGALRRALAGSAALRLRDGSIKGINLAAKLRDARTLIGVARDETSRSNAAEKTDFSELSATFVVRDGIAVNDDLDVRSPLLRIGGAGRVDLGASQIDYTTRVSVVGTLKGQDGRPVEQLRGVTLPVRLAGPLDRMDWNIAWADAAQQALQSRVAEKLAPKLQAGEDRLRDEAQKRARDALKGLLQR
jgi:AsmA protein